MPLYTMLCHPRPRSVANRNRRTAARHREKSCHGRLSDQNLAGLPASVAVPGYDRAAVSPGIVHLGVGAFHRAHQAAYVDDCLAAGEMDWGIVGASLRSPPTPATRWSAGRALHAGERGSDGEPCASSARSRRCWSRRRSRGAAGRADRSAHPHRHADDHRKGLSAQAAGGARRRRIPTSSTIWPTRSAADRAWFSGRGAGAPPRRRHAALHRALLRQPSGQWRDAAPRRCCQFAGLRDAGLARHVADEVAFPSSMVDRIVPATTDADRARIAARSASTTPGR